MESGIFRNETMRNVCGIKRIETVRNERIWNMCGDKNIVVRKSEAVRESGMYVFGIFAGIKNNLLEKAQEVVICCGNLDMLRE